MKYVCEENKCAGCMACIEKCSKNAISIVDSFNVYNAVIDTKKCIKCGACHKVCPNNTQPKLNSPIKWVQGWASNEIERMKSSSGGFATAISKAFVLNGGYVCSCKFEHGCFVFDIVNDIDKVELFRGSKYVKSNPVGIYSKITNLLASGNRVLFVGLPCQVAAVKNYVGNRLQENLYSIDLICHGTPSPKLLNAYLGQDFNIDITELQEIGFRNKTSFALSNKGSRILPERIQDKYTMAFLDSIDYTENCYSCRYATTNRVSDLTIGDSWSSGYSMEETQKGISLGLCQSKKGQWLLSIAELFLTEVNIEQSIKSNRQLQKPSSITSEREKFVKYYNKTGKFSLSVLMAKPLECVKQNVKYFMYRIRILRGGVSNIYCITYVKKNQ